MTANQTTWISTTATIRQQCSTNHEFCCRSLRRWLRRKHCEWRQRQVTDASCADDHRHYMDIHGQTYRQTDTDTHTDRHTDRQIAAINKLINMLTYQQTIQYNLENIYLAVKRWSEQSKNVFLSNHATRQRERTMSYELWGWQVSTQPSVPPFLGREFTSHFWLALPLTIRCFVWSRIYTVGHKKTCHIIWNHNSHVSWWVFTFLAPMETGKNTP